MEDFTKNRINVLNYKIQQLELSKGFFKRNILRIVFFAVFGSAGVVTLGFINDPKRIESPETYDYSYMIEMTLSFFGILLIMVFVAHVFHNLSCNMSIKALQEEKNHLEINFTNFNKSDELKTPN